MPEWRMSILSTEHAHSSTGKGTAGKPPTWLCWEDTHEAREEAVDGTQHLGISTCHTGSNATLQGFETTENSWGLEYSEQETQHF